MVERNLHIYYHRPLVHVQCWVDAPFRQAARFPTWKMWNWNRVFPAEILLFNVVLGTWCTSCKCHFITWHRHECAKWIHIHFNDFSLLLVPDCALQQKWKLQAFWFRLICICCCIVSARPHNSVSLEWKSFLSHYFYEQFFSLDSLAVSSVSRSDDA